MAETNDNSEVNEPKYTKLVPFATAFIENLEALSENDLQQEIQKQMALIVALKDNTDVSVDHLKCVSDFATVSFVLCNQMTAKCKILRDEIGKIKLDWEQETREITELWAERLSRSKQEMNSFQKNKQDEIETLNNQLKESEAKIGKLNKDLVELKKQIEENKCIDQPKQRSEDLSVTRKDLNAMLQEFKTSLITEVLGKPGTIAVSNSCDTGLIKSGLPADWVKICKTITPFNPELRPAVGIEEFLASLKSRLEVRQPAYHNHEKLAILKMVVEGSTSLQIQNYSLEEKNDFDKLCNRLEKDFGRFSCEEAAIEALRGKEGKQKQTEGPSEFLRRLQRLFSKAFGKNFSGREDIQLRLAFVDGLLPHVKSQVEALALTSIDDIVAKAEIFHHKKLKPRDIQVCQVTTNLSNLSIENSQTYQSDVPAQSETSPNGQKKKKGKCYNCGKPNHYAYECRSPKRSQPQLNSQQSDLISSLKQMILRYEDSGGSSTPQETTNQA